MGLTRDRVLKLVGLTKHQYYYKSQGRRLGRKPSKTTERFINNKKIKESNEKVVEKIKETKSDPDKDFGYQKMHSNLVLLGYFINAKKVYRLMRENNLLKVKPKKASKNYVKYRVICPDKPLQLLEMDIKYFWIQESKRYAYVLTIIDTFTRAVLEWTVGFTMKSFQVKQIWEKVIINYLQPFNSSTKQINIEVRNDNGPQFASRKIQEFFKKNYLNQVFTHPYTPQENGHIESFHSILSTAIGKQKFWSLTELEARLDKFYNTYNKFRPHGSICGLPPVMFWNLWLCGQIQRTVLKYKKVKFRLLIPAQKLSGNESLREVPCLENKTLDESCFLQKNNNEMRELHSFQQLSV